MSDLLAMSFDCQSSPTLKLLTEENSAKIHGWGFGWYPDDDVAASVVKDTAKDVSGLTSILEDWRRFRSSTFICKVRGASKRRSQQDTQPFQRSFAGRDWLFLHNGDLDKDKLKELIGPAGDFLEPIGTTDSELVFCFLLQQLQNFKARRLSDVRWETYLSWFSQLDSLGTADFVLSDGQSTIFFHGKNSKRDMYYSRRIPPHQNNHKLEGSSFTLDLSDSLDTFRSAFLVSSSTFNGTGWNQMEPGQMFVVRCSSVVWDSHFGNVTTLAPPSTTTKQEQQNLEVTDFSSQQASHQQTVTNIKSMTSGADGKALEYRSYKVTHLTEYSYSKAVERSTHVLRLQPVEDKIQEVVHSLLHFSVAGQQLQFEDVFGNHATHVTVDQPYTNLAIRMESKIKIFASPGDDFSNPMRRTEMPMVWMPWQRQMMLPYLLPSELPESQLLELTDFAMSFVKQGDYNLVETLNEMNSRIFKDFKYVPGHTTLKTTPFDVYSTRAGVCQDFANLFICLARLLNIPARYRAGYIHTGANYTNKLQSEATHAWVEVYLPYVGWRGYDPTNGCTVAQDHIRIACGRNYRDATPTGGTLYKGGGTETLRVSVQVEELHT